MEMQIIELDGLAIEKRLGELSRVLADSVADGAAISFMAPMPQNEPGTSTSAAASSPVAQRVKKSTPTARTKGSA